MQKLNEEDAVNFIITLVIISLILGAVCFIYGYEFKKTELGDEYARGLKDACQYFKVNVYDVLECKWLEDRKETYLKNRKRPE